MPSHFKDARLAHAGNRRSSAWVTPVRYARAAWTRAASATPRRPLPGYDRASGRGGVVLTSSRASS